VLNRQFKLSLDENVDLLCSVLKAVVAALLCEQFAGCGWLFWCFSEKTTHLHFSFLAFQLFTFPDFRVNSCCWSSTPPGHVLFSLWSCLNSLDFISKASATHDTPCVCSLVSPCFCSSLTRRLSGQELIDSALNFLSDMNSHSSTGHWLYTI